MRSIELWSLQRRDKRLPLPRLAFASIPVGGCYYSPHPSEEEIDGIWIPRDAGIIVVSTDFDAAGATLAHEWRHHWQFHNGWKIDGMQWTYSDDYDAELRHFFTAPWERDALLFELSREKAEHHEEWREILEGII